MTKKHTKSKAQRGLETHRIVYTSRDSPHAQNQELKVDVRRGTVIDLDYAAAMVATATSVQQARPYRSIGLQRRAREDKHEPR